MSIARISTTQAVVNALVGEMLDGTLEPGASLRELELTERLGVSRQSVRAAFAELAFRGFVDRAPHRSVRVATLTASDVRDILFVREVIEGAAIRELAALPDRLAPVEAALRRMEDLPRRSAWNAVAEADVAFHQATVAAVGSSRLIRAHDRIADEMRLSLAPARQYVRAAELGREHRELFEAVRGGDPARAAARFREHLAFGTDRLLTLLPADGPRRSR